MRLYKGTYKVKILQHLGKKCIVEALEETVVGNKACGYDIIDKGTKFVTQTRLLYRCK